MEPNRLKEIIAEEIERVLEQEAARIKLTEAKLRKGDLVGVDDEIGVVNKVKGRVAYIKLPSSPGSFHPIEALRAKYKGKFKGKDLYIAEGKLNEIKLKDLPKLLAALDKKKNGELYNEPKITDNGKRGHYLGLTTQAGPNHKKYFTDLIKKLGFKNVEFDGKETNGSTHLYGWIIKESKLTEAKLARGLKPLLQLGSKITKKVGEDVLVKLSDKFDKIDDEYAGDIASHLDMAIELMQDGYPGDATKVLKQFNKKCKEVLKGKSVGSVFEGKLTEANRSKVFRAAKKGSYPAVIVVIQNGKVIHQEPVSTPEVAPATFNVMQEKYPKAQLHLEDRTGKRLFSESVVNEDFPGKGKTVKAKDLNHEMLDYFNRMNISLSINTKSKKNIKGSVGTMFNDLVFNGGDIDKKDIVSVKILESVVNEAELEFGVEYRDSKGNPKKKGSPIIMRYKNKAAADKFAKKGNQIDKVGGKYTVVRVPMEEDTGKSSPYGSGYKKEKDLNEAEDYKYKKYVTKAFNKISDAMFEFRNAMGVKQLTNKDMKLKKKFEALQADIFALRREMKKDGLTEGKLTEAKPKPLVSKKDIKNIENSGNIDIAYKKAMALLKSLSEGKLTEAMDMNDPILIAIRARKTMLAKEKSAPKQKKISMAQYYKLMDKEIDLINDIKNAYKDYERLDSEMNQDAGQKGKDWTDADANRYGANLDKLQTKIEKLAKLKLAVKKQIMNYRMS